MSPAAVLQILVTANTAQATTALGKTQGQLQATSATASKTGAVMKKALLGVGLAAGAAGVALFKVGEEFDDAYDKIRTRTGATGKEMVKLKRIFRDVVSDVPASFDEASTAVGDLNTRLGLSGRPLGRMSKQMTELARITETDLSGNIESVSKAFVDWEVSTKDQTKTLDGFFRLSQRSGMAVSDIAESVQKFGSPLRQLGFDLDTAAAMFANFERAGVNTATMVPGLKLALANLNAPMGEAETLMRKFNITIGNAPKGLQEVFRVLGDDKVKAVDRISLAMATFGRRAGADMKEAIEQGRFEVEKFLRVMQDGDGTIRETGRQTMDLSEHWQQFTNLLKVQVEPVAKKVFKGLGDLMKEVTKAYKKEGLQGVLDLLVDKLSAAVPKVAEAAGKLGIALAKGLVKGFIDSPLIAKLFMGGLLLRSMGGIGAAGGLGSRLGGRFGTAFGNAAGPIAFGLITAALEGIKFGRTGALSQSRSSAGFLAEELDITLKKAERLMRFMEANPGLGAPESLAAMSQARRQHLEPLQLGFDRVGNHAKLNTEDLRKWANRAGESFGQGRQRALPHLRGLSDDMDRHTKQGGQAMGDNVQRASRRVTDELSRAKSGGKESTFDLAKGVAANIGALAGAVFAGMSNVKKNTDNSLEAFGLKAMKWALESVGNLFGGAQEKQVGGVIVPGVGNGDKVRALLEPGEVVINKKAVAAMGGAQRADRINHLIPRFATGGWVDPAGPGTGVVNPAIAGVVGAWSKRYNAAINYGFDPGGGHISPGHNVTGTATDTGPAGGWGAGPTRLFETGLRSILGKVDQILYGSHGVGTAYPNHGWGNHAHIEWGMHPDVQGAIQAKIARQILQGPKGPLTDMGQGALDTVRKAAQKFIGRKAGASGGADVGSFGSPGLYSLSELVRLWTRVNDGLGNPSTMARIALAESSGNPRAVGNDPGGTTGLGLWQITTGFNDDIIAQFGGRNAMFVPSKNAAAAAAIFRRQGLGAWDASSANWRAGGIVQKLARGGAAKRRPGHGTGWLSGSGIGSSGTGHGTGSISIGSAHATNWGGGSGGVMPQAFTSAHDPLSVLVSLFTARDTAEKIAEQVGVAEIMDAFYTSPAGQDLSPGERVKQIALNTNLLAWLNWQRDLAQLSTTLFPSGTDLHSEFLSEIADLQGITGASGTILDVKRKLDDLNAPASTESVSQSALDALRADLLGEQLMEARRSNAILRAQMPVFGGVFHEGGVVPGPIGQDRMILAQGGEVVSKGESTINVYVDPVSLDTRVEEIVNGQLVKVVRGAATRGGVTGSKAGRYG